jgi:hypothetical protein
LSKGTPDDRTVPTLGQGMTARSPAQRNGPAVHAGASSHNAPQASWLWVGPWGGPVRETLVGGFPYPGRCVAIGPFRIYFEMVYVSSILLNDSLG